MADRKHLEILVEGTAIWNKWRAENPLLQPDLTGANLKGFDLREADLGGARLNRAQLDGADLASADLRGADLSEADLNGVQLSKSTIDINTRYDGIKGCDIGVNGFYSPATDSAALMRLDPPGNSMQGSNAEAVIESLKHARKLHTFSMILAGIGLLFIVIRPKSITLPYLAGSFKFDDLSYAFMAAMLSTGLLSLVATFIDSALQGARYLNDRRSAMTVGHFPWVLSKYEHDPVIRRQSKQLRFFMSFHPMVYLYFFVKWDSLLRGDWAGVVSHYQELPVILGEWLLPVFYLLLLSHCRNIFTLSEGFQKPILFDTLTERDRRSDMERLAQAVETQANEIAELTRLMRSEKKDEPPIKSSS
ncbi:MAG: pentapeptide repeat-containing protein [Chlorobium sp.]|uniref:pentapeptide repeat-containing protein n=1 Tax=Chlorobium sp. TaxID=1095 RepID=UPI0025B98DD2|nr:pentapeptide repeat-containing protein [Chlorobium sp.]MCF8216136.1 pentapeptide repeat-containing protein [Chlorobium sp.]MCF8271097.1 pentapeptide repeat-containing protein [Chlorobium sp.]MCF8287411.1 pentapeptide repeat-containing protein [Chlorobium sp.]MCF8291010.1 pentapeptide repeat-containing protein [Chlorobium sp.]MCF8385105.1 pentapeptide repeat-containing protein [Chlorobium sp.]